VPLLAGSISFQDAHSGSGLIPLFRGRLFEILEFISTLISACRRMSLSSGLSQAALRSCANAQHCQCAAFGDWFRRLSISHWSLPLFYRDWITVMRHWLPSRPACLLNRLQFVLNQWRSNRVGRVGKVQGAPESGGPRVQQKNYLP